MHAEKRGAVPRLASSRDGMLRCHNARRCGRRPRPRARLTLQTADRVPMTQRMPQLTPPPSDSCDLVLVKVAPGEIVQGTWYRMPLLGIGYLAAYARSRGARVAIVDAMFDRLSFEATVARVVARRPALVGFTAMTHEVVRAAQVAREVRRRLPGVRVAVGGPHATPCRAARSRSSGNSTSPSSARARRRSTNCGGLCAAGAAARTRTSARSAAWRSGLRRAPSLWARSGHG